MIGEKIRKLRKENHWRQDQLADILNREFGLKTDRVMISKWETGYQVPVLYTISCLAKIFNVSIDYLNGDGVAKINSKGVSVPVLGYVRAGIPIEAVEDILDYEEISQEMASQGEYFALSVKGDSMEPRITEGDVVIVRKQSIVENGELAVVLVNGNDANVKKFYMNENGVTLISTNPSYDPFYYTKEQVESLPVQVIGKVVELRAKF
ncbi:MAG: helix-turn-helix domain-containing protein [Clostridia bacterium]|nr:helix-turn-helix domain-containing protein [Clostridia bacterium]